MGENEIPTPNLKYDANGIPVAIIDADGNVIHPLTKKSKWERIGEFAITLLRGRKVPEHNYSSDKGKIADVLIRKVGNIIMALIIGGLLYQSGTLTALTQIVLAGLGVG